MLAVNRVIVIALQANMNRLHRSNFTHNPFYLMQSSVLLQLTSVPQSYLTERAEVFTDNMQIH